MINNKFLFFQTLKDFEREKRRGNISSLSIAFIKDQHTIWTHDTYFNANPDFEKSKGYFETLADLLRAYPEPKVGDWAIVGDDTQLEPSEESTVSTWSIANCKEDGHWNLITQTYEHESLDLSEYVKKSDLDLLNYLKIGDIDLSPYLVRSDLNGYLKSTDLDLSEYAKKSDIPDLIAVDAQLNIDSLNPVTNQAVTQALNQKADRQEDIEIVNNLTDGGADKALSAEMGKELLRRMGGTMIDAQVDDEGFINFFYGSESNIENIEVDEEGFINISLQTEPATL